MTMTPKELAEDLRCMATCSLEIERRKLAAAAAALDDLDRIRSVTIEGVAEIEEAYVGYTGPRDEYAYETTCILTLLDVVRAMGADLQKARESIAAWERLKDRLAEEAATSACEAVKNEFFTYDVRERLLLAERDAARAEVERLNQELVAMNEAGADAASNAHGQGQENALADVARELGWGEWPKDGWERLQRLRTAISERDRLKELLDLHGAGKVITHECPPSGEALTPCCNRTPFELPRTDRMTVLPQQVNCDRDRLKQERDALAEGMRLYQEYADIPADPPEELLERSYRAGDAVHAWRTTHGHLVDRDGKPENITEGGDAPARRDCTSQRESRVDVVSPPVGTAGGDEWRWGLPSEALRAAWPTWELDCGYVYVFEGNTFRGTHWELPAEQITDQSKILHTSKYRPKGKTWAEVEEMARTKGDHDGD